MVCAPLVTVSSLLTTLPWPERFDEDVAVAFGEPPYQGESVCLEAVFVIDGPPPPPRNQPSTESCRAGGANHHQPAARPQNSKCLAQDLAALIRTHPAQVPACVVDDDDIEYVAIRGNTSGGSRFDVDENARVGGATTCTFGRRLVGHDRRRSGRRARRASRPRQGGRRAEQPSWATCSPIFTPVMPTTSA